MTEQTRGSRRFASNRPLQLRCPDWQEFVRTYVRDISSGGMFIQTEQAPPILSFIEVQVELPEGDALNLNARVVHVIPREQAGPNGTPGIGVEFQDVSPEARARIQALMRHASQDQTRAGSGVHTVPAPGQRSPSQPTFQAVVLKPPSRSAAASAKDEKATLNRLTADLKAIGAKTDHEILGVDQRVDETTLRAAFIAQSKLYHPDLFAQYSSPEIRQVATQIFVRIKRAFTQIGEKIKQRDPQAAAASLARALGNQHPGTSQTRPAPLRSPLPPSNEPGSVIALLTDAKRHVMHKRYEEAQRTLEKALAIDPHHRDVKIWFYTVRARRLKLEGDQANALEHYRLVLELDEKNLEAAKELRSSKETVVFGMRFKKD